MLGENYEGSSATIVEKPTLTAVDNTVFVPTIHSQFAMPLPDGYKRKMTLMSDGGGSIEDDEEAAFARARAL